MERDLELIERFQHGDKSAFDELMTMYYRPVLNLIYRFTGANSQRSEDMAQEIFLGVYKALPRYEARARFFTFLYRVTMNYCLRERTKEFRERKSTYRLDADWDDPDSLEHIIPDPAGSVETAVVRQEVGEAVRQAVLALPEEQRAAVLLYRFDNLSYEEIGQVLGISLPAVKSRLHRAKLSLQKLLRSDVKME